MRSDKSQVEKQRWTMFRKRNKGALSTLGAKEEDRRSIFDHEKRNLDGLQQGLTKEGGVAQTPRKRAGLQGRTTIHQTSPTQPTSWPSIDQPSQRHPDRQPLVRDQPQPIRTVGDDWETDVEQVQASARPAWQGLINQGQGRERSEGESFITPPWETEQVDQGFITPPWETEQTNQQEPTDQGLNNPPWEEEKTTQGGQEFAGVPWEEQLNNHEQQETPQPRTDPLFAPLFGEDDQEGEIPSDQPDDPLFGESGQQAAPTTSRSPAFDSLFGELSQYRQEEGEEPTDNQPDDPLFRESGQPESPPTSRSPAFDSLFGGSGEGRQQEQADDQLYRSLFGEENRASELGAAEDQGQTSLTGGTAEEDLFGRLGDQEGEAEAEAEEQPRPASTGSSRSPLPESVRALMGGSEMNEEPVTGGEEGEEEDDSMAWLRDQMSQFAMDRDEPSAEQQSSGAEKTNLSGLPSLMMPSMGSTEPSEGSEVTSDDQPGMELKTEPEPEPEQVDERTLLTKYRVTKVLANDWSAGSIKVAVEVVNEGERVLPGSFTVGKLNPSGWVWPNKPTEVGTSIEPSSSKDLAFHLSHEGDKEGWPVTLEDPRALVTRDAPSPPKGAWRKRTPSSKYQIFHQESLDQVVESDFQKSTVGKGLVSVRNASKQSSLMTVVINFSGQNLRNIPPQLFFPYMPMLSGRQVNFNFKAATEPLGFGKKLYVDGKEVNDTSELSSLIGTVHEVKLVTHLTAGLGLANLTVQTPAVEDKGGTLTTSNGQTSEKQAKNEKGEPFTLQIVTVKELRPGETVEIVQTANKEILPGFIILGETRVSYLVKQQISSLAIDCVPLTKTESREILEVTKEAGNVGNWTVRSRLVNDSDHNLALRSSRVWAGEVELSVQEMDRPEDIPTGSEFTHNQLTHVDDSETIPELWNQFDYHVTVERNERFQGSTHFKGYRFTLEL